MSSSHPVARPARLRMANALVSRLLAISPRTADLALAVVLVLATMNFGAGGTPPNSVSDTLLLMAGAATVAVRRRWPLAVLIATLVPYAAAPTTTPGEPAVLVALYTVASLRSQRTAVLAAGLAATVSVVAVFVHGDDAGLALARVLEVFAAGLVGLVVAERRHQRAREGRMRAEIAAADERVRIARELHDVVAHHLSVMVVQANLASEMMKPDDPALVPTQAVVATGRQALADTRRVLGVLRSREDSDERAPQPGLAALDELLERVRVTGLNVKLSTEGDAVPLSSGLELSAYRIVQEALSNTLRHAQASEARVTVRYLPSSLALEVSDDGIGAAGNGSASGGHGLEGMRERVALFGGTLTAGPNPGRGFRVHAELPL